MSRTVFGIIRRPGETLRVTRIFTTLRTAQMTARCNRREGFTHVRIDPVPKPEAHHPRFLVLADHKPLPEPSFPKELLDA